MHNNISTFSATQRLIVNLLLAVSILASFVIRSTSVFAQGTTPPVDPNSAWGEVMNPDGSINYDSLTDGGVVSQPADWMPNIPLIGPVDAEYHVYTTPSGNTILMPTASTLFFMAANPNESGFNAAASTLGTSGLSVADGTNTFTGIAGLGTMLASMTGNGPDATLTLPSGEQILSSDFFQQVVSGQQDIFALGPTGLTNFLSSLFSQTSSDLQSGDGLNLYTYMLLYPPAQCGSVPGGCTPEQLALLQQLANVEVTETPPAPNSCPAPEVIPGRIIKTGTRVAPNYPLVVGQDPDKRGVDISVSVSVQPTVVKSWEPEPVTECKDGPNANGVSNCKTKDGKAGHEKIVDWTCKEHQQIYQECIKFASADINLTGNSRDWILNELSIRYPNAYLHKPRIALGSSHNCSWNQTYPKIQVADPGYFDINISGQTSGTPVSAPRTFGGGANQFGVWLKEIAIIK
jgi:hypothetical protein